MPEVLNLPMTSIIPKGAFGAPLRWYHWLPWLLVKAFRLVFPLRVEGADLLPRTGPALVIAPHMCYSDSLPFLYTSLPRPPRFVGSAFFVLANAPVSWLMFAGGAIPLYKHIPDIQGARRILRLLAAGEVVVLFPEGERSWAGVPLDPLVPSAKFLARLKVPIYLAQVEGSYDHWPRWDDLPRRRPVTVRLRGPITLPGATRTRRDAQLARHWWQSVYERGYGQDSMAARDALSSLLREASLGEDARLNLFRCGRFRRVSRLICFCPECAGPRTIADKDRLVCPDCGAAWRPAANGTLSREGTTDTLAPRLLSKVFLQMLATLRARIGVVLPLEEAIEVSVMGHACKAAARGRAVLDRTGLKVITAARTWSVDLASAADGQLEGSRVLEIHARDGSALSLRSDGGALRLVLAACALHDRPWSRFAAATSVAAESEEPGHA